ncbi:MAG: DNA recombination protein RmuC [Candidatus Shapirobacteria bacterium]
MILVYILLSITIGLLVFFIIRQGFSKPADVSIEIANKLNELFPQLIKSANDSLITMADQKLGAKKDEINVDLTNKKEAIEKMISQVLEELNRNQNKLEAAEKERVGSFSALSQKLDEQKSLTQQLSATADGLKKVLSNNQMRGQFGEEVAEELLKSSGFVEGINYQKQTTGTSSSRPDITILMPNGLKVNVDVKFPYTNLVKMTEAEDPVLKEQYSSAFHASVKTKIKEVTTREYINPSDNTVDFVVLFIPNEMIFSYIYEKYSDLRQEAFQKKVVLAGPFGFTALIRLIQQAHENFHFQKNIQQIVNHINEFLKQFNEYNESVTLLGNRIKSVSEQFEKVDTTRSRQLLRVVDKIRLESSTDSGQTALEIQTRLDEIK